MTTFAFSAAKQNGELVKGERDAENEKLLAQALRSEGLFLLQAKGLQGRSFFSRLNFSFSPDAILSAIKSVGMVDKLFFTRNLAVMISAGLSLTKAFDGLIEEASNAKFKKILQEVNEAVVKGRSLAEAMQPHEKVFGILFVNMIEVGETTGKLALVLKLLGNQMKKDYDLRKRVKGAMMYPAVIITALFGVGALMMIYVVPSLTATIKELGVELPMSTKVIIFISDFLTNYLIFALLGLAALVTGFVFFLRSKMGKIIFDTVILKVPIFGKLVMKVNVARFTRTLGYLIASGVPIVRSLEITSKVLGNTHYQNAVAEAAVAIQKGKTLNEVISGYPKLFSPLVIQMIKVGEETGKVTDLLLRVALFFEEEVNEVTKNLSTIIEPILMIFIGGVVGFFAVSMLQPIYSSLGNL